jgi:hypothetical protein
MKTATIYTPLTFLSNSCAKLLDWATAIAPPCRMAEAVVSSTNIHIGNSPMGFPGWPLINPMILIERPAMDKQCGQQYSGTEQ